MLWPPKPQTRLSVEDFLAGSKEELQRPTTHSPCMPLRKLSTNSLRAGKAKAHLRCTPISPNSGQAAKHHSPSALLKTSEALHSALKTRQGGLPARTHHSISAQADELLTSPSLTDIYLRQPWHPRGCKGAPDGNVAQSHALPCSVLMESEPLQLGRRLGSRWRRGLLLSVMAKDHGCNANAMPY